MKGMRKMRGWKGAGSRYLVEVGEIGEFVG
jgi:hypothetical protein